MRHRSRTFRTNAQRSGSYARAAAIEAAVASIAMRNESGIRRTAGQRYGTLKLTLESDAI
jgi:hypothetical protein